MISSEDSFDANGMAVGGQDALALGYATREETLAAIREGKPVLVVDDASRENEGDAIISAQLASPHWVGWMVRHTSGYICAPLPDVWANRLGLPLMVADSEDPHGTAYTLSVDAADRASTGISATERAHTLNVLANPESTAASVMRPGHVLPLRAVPGGLAARRGHTESGVALMQLAGLSPVAALSELVDDWGEMLRAPEVLALGASEGLPVVTVEQIAEWMGQDASPAEAASGQAADAAPGAGDGLTALHPAAPRLVEREAEAHLPTRYGDFTIFGYRDLHNDRTLVALVAPTPEGSAGIPLVRIHSECATGDIFGSLRCECGPQLHEALRMVAQQGGAVIYVRGHEGRGIGLMQKLRAYKLQEHGLDTVDANRALGFGDDLRDYGSAADIVRDLGYDRIRLLTNNPDKVSQLEQHGVKVVERVPLIVGASADNVGYLETKRERMGHLLPDPLPGENVGAHK